MAELDGYFVIASNKKHALKTLSPTTLLRTVLQLDDALGKSG